MPGAPTNLLLERGDGQVTLTWEAPEDGGGSEITDYEYRINGQGDWISIGSTDTTYTVTGLDNDTVYTFEVRAVNGIGRSQPSSDPVEATPRAGVALDFAHFANGASITSSLVFVNVAAHPIRPALDFYDKEGNPIAAETVVDVTEDLEITEDGSLSVRTAMEPFGELTISTHGRGEVMSGSVKAVSNGPMGGVLRFDLSDIGVAGVGASLPLTDALFPVRRAGKLSTAAAIRNLSESELMVSCRLMQADIVLEETEIPLEASGQEAQYIEEMFTHTDTSDFVGSVRCMAPGLFTGIAVELDAENRIFTTLPVVPVDPSVGGGRETVLDFAHFANGAGITSELVFVNRSTQPSRPAPTHFHSDILPNLPVLYFYDQSGDLIDPASVVDVTGDLVVTEDGTLTVQDGDGAPGSAHDLDPRPGRALVGIGEGHLGPPHWRLSALQPPGHRSGRGGSQPARKGRHLPRSATGGRNQHRGGDPQPGRGSDRGELPVDERRHRARRGVDPSSGQRARGPVHRRDVHRYRYIRFRRVGALHGSHREGGNVHRSGRGTQ